MGTGTGILLLKGCRRCSVELISPGFQNRG